MTNRLGLVEVSVLAQKQARLHSEIVTILFENRRYIKTIFLDIHGLYEIAHVGLTIIDPSADLVVFSSTPNIEYNLIQQNLWRNDPCFSPSIQNNHELSWWNDHKITSDLEKIKLKNNQLTEGLTISRQINDFYLLYSFATRSKRVDLRAYYASNLFGLLDLGDYFYKSIRSIYSSYCKTIALPELGDLTSRVSTINNSAKLRLIANNSIIRGE